MEVLQDFYSSLKSLERTFNYKVYIKPVIKDLHVDHKQGRNFDPSPATLVKETAGFAAFNSVEEARENAPNILEKICLTLINYLYYVFSF